MLQGTNEQSRQRGVFPAYCVTEIVQPTTHAPLAGDGKGPSLNENVAEDRTVRDARLTQPHTHTRPQRQTPSTTDGTTATTTTLQEQFTNKLSQFTNGLSRRLNRAIQMGTQPKVAVDSSTGRPAATTSFFAPKTSGRVLYAAKQEPKSVHVDIFSRNIDPSSVELRVACTGGVIQYSTVDPVSGTQHYTWNFETRRAIEPNASAFKVKRSKLELVFYKATTMFEKPWATPLVWPVEPRELVWQHNAHGDGRISAPASAAIDPFASIALLNGPDSTGRAPCVNGAPRSHLPESDWMAEGPPHADFEPPPLEVVLPAVPNTTAMGLRDSVQALDEWLPHAIAARMEAQAAAAAHRHVLQNVSDEGLARTRQRHAYDVEVYRKRHQQRIKDANAERDCTVAHSERQLERETTGWTQRLSEATNELRFPMCSTAPALADADLRIAEVRRLANEAHDLADTLARNAHRPHEHFCPVTFEVMRDPVIVTSCGDTFEREAIQQWFRDTPTCPLCRNPASRKGGLAPNKALKNLIQDWDDSDSTTRHC